MILFAVLVKSFYKVSKFAHRISPGLDMSFYSCFSLKHLGKIKYQRVGNSPLHFASGHARLPLIRTELIQLSENYGKSSESTWNKNSLETRNVGPNCNPGWYCIVNVGWSADHSKVSLTETILFEVLVPLSFNLAGNGKLHVLFCN